MQQDLSNRWTAAIRRRFAIAAALLCAGLALSVPTSQARADYIAYNGSEVAPNIAEIRVGTDGVTIRLEVFVGDMQKFQALVPDDWFKASDPDRPDQAARLAAFAETGLSVRRSDGQALPVSVNTIEPRMRIDRTNALSGQIDPLTGRQFPAPPSDPRVLFVELFYDFGGNRPDVVTIAPPMNDEGLPVATIGMIVFDRGVPVTNFRYLSMPVTLTVDWEDPWYSRFNNPNLARHQQSGVTTFIYVEPREIRHETLFRLRDIDPWLGLDLASGDMLTPEDQARIKTQAGAYLMTRNPVRIDEVSVTPEHMRTELLMLDPSGLQVLEGNVPISADAAFLGIILSFPVRDLPRTVDVTWEMFNDRISQVPATATDLAGPFLSGATPDDPVIVWTNHLLTYENPQVQKVRVAGTLSVPVLTVLGIVLAATAAFFAVRRAGAVRLVAWGAAVVLLAGAALTYDTARVSLRNPFEAKPPDTDAQTAIAGLLAEIRVALLETSPQARAEQLGVVATDESLVDVSAELDRGLAIQVQGGGVARMTELGDVSLTDIQPASDGYGFRALAEWSAVASAEHWGHKHVRDVRYRALVEVLAEEGAWKLDGITVLEARTPNA